MKPKMMIGALVLSLFCCATAKSQEVLKVGQAYSYLAISTDNNQIMGVTKHKGKTYEGEKFVRALGAFDRKTGKETIFFESDGSEGITQIAYVPDWSTALAVGLYFFGGWDSHDFRPIFQTKGREQENTHNIFDQLVAPRS